MADKEDEHAPRKIKIVARTEFTPEEIFEARKAKKKRFAMEMEIYNLRAMRGDFDTY